MILGRNRDVVRPWTRITRVDGQTQLKTGFFARVELQLQCHGGGSALHHRDGSVARVLGLTPDPRRRVYASLSGWRGAVELLAGGRKHVPDQELLVVNGGDWRRHRYEDL